ncbi:MauE/DoxX family redox-associated membrane protein [Bacillus cereus]|uniref:MauE/DoxX family redox-associated membrane protein n=1 Tax=Bacillus cereus TaxID=1396 RepID=UPI0038FBEF3F
MGKINILSTFIDLIIAFIFFASFYMKIYSIQDLKCDLILYDIFPVKHIWLVSYMTLILEFCIFNMFAFNMFYPFKEIGTIILMAFFIVLILRKKQLYKLEKTSCSCFGKMRFMNKAPTVRNSLIITLLIVKTLLPSPSRTAEMSMILVLLSIYIVLFYNIRSLKNNSKERLLYQNESIHNN